MSQQAIGATIIGEHYVLMRTSTDGVKEMPLAASSVRLGITDKDSRRIDVEQKCENEGKAKREGGAEVNRRGKLKGVHYDHLGSLRSLENEKGKNPALSSVSMRSLKYKKNYSDESPVENEDEMSKVQKGDELRVSQEGMKTKLKGKAVVPPAGSPLMASDLPLRIPSPCLDQAIINLSSIIGIDPNQFDPATYVEEDFYVMDAFGVSRLIPPTNIIRRREVWNPDGTTSGSYQSQGKISRKMMVMPSFVSSNSILTGLVDSMHKKLLGGPKNIENSASSSYYTSLKMRALRVQQHIGK
ncbi:hypothetical protein Sango_3063600 [Sesamum angolense]|uniref:Uncharacterized protein n=1 Tax=Sesamum angolense TaxID=2727404 RepID=A0AAE1TAF1_9LAMI|nr:hypothetical protein Sango_3063600 [Sesamum angolense]